MSAALSDPEQHNHVPSDADPAECHFCRAPSSAHRYAWGPDGRSRPLTQHELAARAADLGSKRVTPGAMGATEDAT